MFLRSTFLCLAAALTAQGVLLPPSTTEKTSTHDTAPLENMLFGSMNEKILTYKCLECIKPTKVNNNTEVKILDEHVDNLVMNFSIPLKDRHTLYLNDYPIFWTGANHAPQVKPVPAPVVVGKHSASDAVSALQGEKDTKLKQLSFRLIAETKPGKVPGHRVHKLNFQIMKVDDVESPRVGFFEISVFEFEPGKLTLGAIEKHLVPGITGEGHCMSLPLLCKWKALIQAKVAKLKAGIKSGCARVRHGAWKHGHGKLGSLRAHPRPHTKEQPKNKPEVTDKQPHQVQNKETHKPTALDLFKDITSDILVPAFLGISAGMILASLAYFTWRLTSMFWTRCIRRNRSYGRVALSEEDEVIAYADEKGDLPAYEAAVVEANQH